jgi:hypothetical protein
LVEFLYGQQFARKTMIEYELRVVKIHRNPA